MKYKKISKDHLQRLLDNFERNEKVNLFLMIIIVVIIIFIGLIYIYLKLICISILTFILMILIFYISYKVTYSPSLHLKPKKDKKMIDNLKSFLINGTKGEDDKLENILEKITLTERHYKINQLIYISYFLMVISLEFFILSLYERVSILFNLFFDENIFRVVINYNIELVINLTILLILTLRYVIFKNIRKMREILNGMVIEELTKFEEQIENILNLKIKECNYDKTSLLENLQTWSDLYLGSYFVGLKQLLLISDYKNLVYSLVDEIYYYNLFTTLKFKLNESHFFNFENRVQNNKKVKNDYINDLIKLNIKRLDDSIRCRMLEKNERRNKIKTTQTWFAIISIPLSIIFSLVALLLF